MYTHTHTHLTGSPVCHAALVVCRCSLPSEPWIPAVFPVPLQRAEDKNIHQHNHHASRALCWLCLIRAHIKAPKWFLRFIQYYMLSGGNSRVRRRTPSDRTKQEVSQFSSWDRISQKHMAITDMLSCDHCVPSDWVKGGVRIFYNEFYS